MKRFYKTALPAVLAAALLFLSACGTQEKQAGEGGASGAANAGGTSFGTFTATDIKGDAVTESIFKGHKLTMVNIWATFCGPCIREMPDLGELNQEYKEKGFQVIGIVSDATDVYGTVSQEQVEAAKEIIEKTGASYQHILPSKSLIETKLKDVQYVPTTVFVDENGNQVGKEYASAKTKAQWKAIIDSLL